MYVLLRLWLRCWLFLLRLWAERGWGRCGGRRGGGGGAASCSGAEIAAEAVAAPPQHAAAPGCVSGRLRSFWCPPHAQNRLGWCRACSLTRMAELEQPGRAEEATAGSGCAGQGSGEEGSGAQVQKEAPPAVCAGPSPGDQGCPGAWRDPAEASGAGFIPLAKGGCIPARETCPDSIPKLGSSLAPGIGSDLLSEGGSSSLAPHTGSDPLREMDNLFAGIGNDLVGEVGGSLAPGTDQLKLAGCSIALGDGIVQLSEVVSSLPSGGGSHNHVSETNSLALGQISKVGRNLASGVGSDQVSEVGSCLVPGDGSGPVSEVGNCLAPELGSQVHITVAIEAAEDEDHENHFLAMEGGGSCSEDDRNDKYSGAATSGGEYDNDELDPNWKPPEQELIEKLIVQIEYYLSDENLEKDAFLLKHVRRNKMGYVSVKLLTSFKKVKHLTRDWRTTAYALKYSDILELNEDNRKIRRKTSVPVFPSENLPSKMLLVHDFHLFPELQSLNKEQENGGMQEKVMEQLLKLFGLFGVISSVRILKPGRDLPPDVKRFSSRYNQVGTKECAIVEYEEVEAAIKAQESMGLSKENEAGMKVILIGMKPPKKKIPKDKNRDEESKNRKAKSLNKRVEELQYVGDESPVYSSSEPDSNPTSPMTERKYKTTNKLSPSTYNNNHLSPNASPRSSPWNSPSGQRKVGKISPLADGTSPEFPRKCMDYSSDSSITPTSSPWVQRRRQAQTVTQEKSPVGSPMLGRKIQNADGLPLGVLRLPKGPDGTKGFHNGMERNKPMQNLEIT